MSIGLVGRKVILACPALAVSKGIVKTVLDDAGTLRDVEDVLVASEALGIGMRIVTDRDAPGATAVAASLEEVRGLVKGVPRPGGPIV